MPQARTYAHMARAFHAEGVRCIFSLTGDGNMHWEAAMAGLPGLRSIHVRHEHCAVAMATGFAAVSDQVGVASVTCGPGLTQIMTALATAVQAHIPLVILAGEDPASANWYNQRIDQGPLVTATGAIYMPARSLPVIPHVVHEAFFRARRNKLPIVIGVPLDLQQIEGPDWDYRPAWDTLPRHSPRAAHPDDIAAAAARLAAARHVMIVGGRGMKSPGARQAAQDLAELLDGGLCCTLPVRGLFNGHRRDLGVAGGFAHQVTRRAFDQADLVLAVGTSLTRHTSDLNTLFSPDKVIQIDTAPDMRHGQIPADQVIAADAELALHALIAALEGGARPASSWDIPALARAHATDPADLTPQPVEPARLDPREVIAALDQHLPKDWAMVNSAGHSSYFATHFHGRDANDFLTIREFGAIGNGLSYAIGRWAYQPAQPVVLIEGDGGFLMHVQELDTVMRSRMKILCIILNDGAYGSEIHKLRADGLSDKGAVFGFGDLAGIARGFGMPGEVVTDLAQIGPLARAFAAGDGPALWDIRISDRVMAPTMRRVTRRDRQVTAAATPQVAVLKP